MEESQDQHQDEASAVFAYVTKLFDDSEANGSTPVFQRNIERSIAKALDMSVVQVAVILHQLHRQRRIGLISNGAAGSSIAAIARNQDTLRLPITVHTGAKGHPRLRIGKPRGHMTVSQELTGEEDADDELAELHQRVKQLEADNAKLKGDADKAKHDKLTAIRERDAAHTARERAQELLAQTRADVRRLEGQLARVQQEAKRVPELEGRVAELAAGPQLPDELTARIEQLMTK